MERNRCIILGAESVDSNSLNRCLMNLYDFADEKCSKSIELTSDNFPSSPFFSGGYKNALTDIDYVSSITFVQEGATEATPITSASTTSYGVAQRLYGNSLQKCLTINDNFSTETATGVYHYTETDIANFVPTVDTLYTADSPLIFSALLDDDTKTLTDGTSALGVNTTPVIDYNSYMVCGYTGVSFGQITFKRSNSDTQNNTIAINITRDLINRDDVDTIKFFSVSNGVASGVQRISENKDMVTDLGACNVTYTSDDDIVISNITKNDNSEVIRIDKETGRILDDDEEMEYGKYTELSNDEISLNFFVVFDTRKDFVAFDNSTWCFYLCDDYNYARTYLSKADSYARGSIKYDFSGFEAADDGYEDYLAENPHQVYNTIRSSKDAFNGCFNATFTALSHFSTSYEYTDRMFKNCHHATFDSLPTYFTLPRLKTASSMFEKCVAADFAKLNTLYFPRSTKLTRMFYGCTEALFSELAKIDVNGACGFMFYGDYNAEFKKLSTVCGGATVLDYMFCKCSNSDFVSLTSIESSANNETVRANHMFEGLSANTFPSLQYISLGTNSYNADSMFKDCTNATFESLTSIGEPKMAEYQFYGCSTANFDNITSLGTHLRDGQHMFQNCTSLEMEIRDDLPNLNDATEMFENSNIVTIYGNMNELVIADRMCANMRSAIIYGDMNKLTTGRNMFLNTDIAYVDGSVDSLYDADSMFMNTSSARISEVPSSLVYMLNMFSYSESCSVYDYQPAVARKISETQYQNRISDSAFSYAGNVEITGNILSGDIESTSDMFLNAGSKGVVRLFNPFMESPTDKVNRYYYSDSNVHYTVTKGIKEDGVTTLYSMTNIDDLPLERKTDVFGLTVDITDSKTNYTLYLSSSDYGYQKTIGEGDFDYKSYAYSVNASNGNTYFISNAFYKLGSAWTVNQIDEYAGTSTLKYNVEVFDVSTEETKVEKSITYLLPSGETSTFRVWSEGVASNYIIKIKDEYYGKETIVNSNLENSHFEVDINFIVDDDEDTNAVAVITDSSGSTNMFKLSQNGTLEILEYTDDLFIDGNPLITAYLYQIYKDGDETLPFGFMIAMRETGNYNTKYYLYDGGYEDETVDFSVEQGTIYSLDVVLDDTSTDLKDVKVSFGIGNAASYNGISNSFIEADEMFRGVVSDSLLSGYNSVISKSLTTTNGMFSLDEKVDGDPTFKNTGHLFSLMTESNIVDSANMFKNRYVCDATPFYNFGTEENAEYSFHVPKGVIDATSMYENCTMPNENIEFGLNIPTTLVHAKNMFKDFSGGKIRLGYGANGSIVINDALEYEGMFENAPFANTEGNNFNLTIPRVNMSIFRGSDYKFNNIEHIKEVEGRYFAPINMTAGQAHSLDNTEKIFETDAEGGAELAILDNDLSTWFDEGIYLATVLGPSGNEYRLQTDYLTSGRMRGHYQMAECNSSATTEEAKETYNKLISLSDYTKNFQCGNMNEACGERITAMFNPLRAIGFSNGYVGDRLINLMVPSSFEYLATASDSYIGRSYPNAKFNRVKTIEVNEMPFAFEALSSGIFGRLKTIEGGIINAAGSFMNCKHAKFNNLTEINVNSIPSVGSFESAYTELTSTSGQYWNGNYIDMFANDNTATFGSLESVMIKSSFFRLYPISERLDEGWYQFKSNPYSVIFGNRNTYNFEFLDIDKDGHAKFTITNRLGESICEFETAESVVDQDVWLHLIEAETIDHKPCIDIRISIPKTYEKTPSEDGRIIDRYTVYTDGLVDCPGIELTNDSRLYYSNYLLAYFEEKEGGDDILNFILKRMGVRYHYTIQVEKGEEYLEIVVTNTVSKNKTICKTAIPSDIEKYTMDVEFGEINETSDESELNYDPIVIVSLVVNNIRIYYTAYKNDSETEEFTFDESLLHPAINDRDNTRRNSYDLTSETEQTIIFGKKEYIIGLEESSAEYYTLTIKNDKKEELLSFMTLKSTLDHETLELIEINTYNDDSGEYEDAVVFNFEESKYRFIMFDSGTIIENDNFPNAVRYRLLTKYQDCEHYHGNNKSYCDGIFLNCSSATFKKLKTVSVGGYGSCSKMFANCSNMELKKLEAFYMPTAFTYSGDDNGAICYRGLFSGCNYEDIDLSTLDDITTNIHKIGYDGTKTKGRALFEDIVGAKINSAEDAYKYLGLSMDVGSQMDWGEYDFLNLDMSFVYDGKEHTIDTETLSAAVLKTVGLASSDSETESITAKIYYAKTDGETVDDADWQLEAPTFKNAGKYVIWYKVVASNRKDYIDNAKLTIEKFDISSTESNIRVNATTSFKYDGAEHTIDITDVSVQHKGQTDWQPITYDVVGILSAIAIGNYTFTIVCDGNYTGEKIVKWEIVAKTVDPSSVAADGYNGIYDGNGHSISLTVASTEGTPTITYSDKEDGDYSSTNPSYVNVGDYTTYYRVKFTGCVPLTGSAKVSITALDIYTNKCNIELEADTYYYDGTTKTVSVKTITCNGFDVTYTLSGTTSAINASSYTFTINGNGNFNGKKNVEWSIVKSDNSFEIEPTISSWREDGSPSEPSLGKAKYGSVSQILYRIREADISTATKEKPSSVGLYTARFVVEETDNYKGLTRDVDFAILGVDPTLNDSFLTSLADWGLSSERPADLPEPSLTANLVSSNYILNDGYVDESGTYNVVDTVYKIKNNLDKLSTVNFPWMIWGYDLDIPEYVKYRNGNDFVYLRSVQNVDTEWNTAESLVEDFVGKEIYGCYWNSDEYKREYVVINSVESVSEETFTYGNNCTYSVPQKITDNDGKEYTFCGHTATLHSKNLVTSTNDNGTTLRYHEYFNSKGTARYLYSMMRQYINSRVGYSEFKPSEEYCGEKYSQSLKYSQSNGLAVYSNGLLTKFYKDTSFIKKITNQVNRVYNYSAKNNPDICIDEVGLIPVGYSGYIQYKDVIINDTSISSLYGSIEYDSLRVKYAINIDGSPNTDIYYRWCFRDTYYNHYVFNVTTFNGNLDGMVNCKILANDYYKCSPQVVVG